MFWKTVVERLRLELRYDESKLASIPRTGPLVVLANHPFGVLDGSTTGYIMFSPAKTALMLGRQTSIRE